MFPLHSHLNTKKSYLHWNVFTWKASLVRGRHPQKTSGKNWADEPRSPQLLEHVTCFYRFNLRAPQFPLLLHPPPTRPTTLTYRALVFTAPSLLLSISTHISTPRHLSTAWPWNHLHTVLHLGGSNQFTQHSACLSFRHWNISLY